MTSRWLASLLVYVVLSVSQIAAQSESTESHFIAYIANGPCENGTALSICPTRIGFLNISTGEHEFIDTGAVQIETLAYSADRQSVVYRSLQHGLMLFDLTFQTRPIIFPSFSGIPERIDFTDLFVIAGVIKNDDAEGLYMLAPNAQLPVISFLEIPNVIVQVGLSAIPRWSPESRQTAFVVFDTSENITKLIVTSFNEVISVVDTSDAPFNTACLGWSVDGQQLAYLHPNGEIFVSDLVNAPQSYAFDGCVLGWSDESSLVIRTANADDETEFWQLDLNSGEISLIFSRGRSWLVQMSPDRQRIAYNARGGDPRSPQICILELSTRDETCFDSLNMYESGVITWGK